MSTHSDVVFEGDAHFALDDLDGLLIGRVALLDGLSDDTSRDVYADGSDISQVGEQARLGVLESGGEGSERVDSGHDHRGGDGLGSSEDRSESESWVDKGVVGLSDGVCLSAEDVGGEGGGEGAGR